MFRKLLLIFALILIGIFSVNPSFAKEEQSLDDNKKTESQEALSGNVVINIDSEQVDYFPDDEKFVATGNVIIHVLPEGTVLESKKVVYDKAEDYIIAENEVKITKNKQIIEGDYLRIDLVTDSYFINNPVTDLNKINIVAKKANIHPSKKDPEKKITTAYKGRIVINDPDRSFFISRSGSKFVRRIESPLKIDENPDKVDKKKDEKPKAQYDVHSKEIIIDKHKDYSDVITLKNATITVNKKYKIAKVPSITMVADRDTNRTETTFPEFGQTPDLGAFIGYGPVFILPKGATLKLVPLFTWGDKENGGRGVGFGGWTRLMTDSNKTEVGYSTLKNKMVLNGFQTISFPRFGKKKDSTEEQTGLINNKDATRLQYGLNSYMNNGFMGAGKFPLVVELVDDRKLFSAYGMDFDLRSSAGYIEKNGQWGTGRYQTQGKLYNIKPFFNIGKHIGVGSSTQFSMAMYGNGDSYGVFRAGPSLNTQFGRFYSTVTYYQAAVYGESPLELDEYYYGKSNIDLNSSLKICRNLMLRYYTSLNLLRDNWDSSFLAENHIGLAIGPDDMTFTLAYDLRRKALTWDFSLWVDTNRTAFNFDKLQVRE